MRQTLIALLAVFVSTPALAEDPVRFPGIPSIAAVGSAREAVAPDRAVVQFHVDGRADRTEQLAPDLAQKAQRLVAALRAAGVPDGSMSSAGPYISDVYATVRDNFGREVPDQRRRIGVQGHFSLKVNLEAIGSVAAILQAGSETGAKVVDVDFLVHDAAAVRDRLRRAAARAAVERARAMAEAIGARPGRILSVVDPNRRVGEEAADLGIASGPTQIQFPILPGDAQFTEQVEVLMELLQRAP